MPTLSSILVQRGAASMRAVEDAIARQVLHGGDLPTNLLELGAVAEPVLTAVLAECFALEPAPVGHLPAPAPGVLRLLPGDLAARHAIFPIELRERVLWVATAEPLSPAVEDDLGFALDLSLKQLAAPHVRVRQAISECYGVPLDRRFTRLVAKLDGRGDPHPTARPPEEPELLHVRPQKTISIPVPSFGTGVSHPPEPGRLGEVPATKTPYNVDSGPAFPMPVIPPHAPLSLEELTPSVHPVDVDVEPEPRRKTVPFPSVQPPASPSRPAPAGSAPPPGPFPIPTPAREEEPAPIAEEAPPAETPSPVKAAQGTRALAGWLRHEIKNERTSALLDKTRAELRPAFRGVRRKGPFTAAMAESELESAATSDAVLDVLFSFVQQYFEYTALFVIHGDLAEGRDAAGSGASRDRVAGIGVPLDLPSSVATARLQRAPLIAPLGSEGLDAELRRDLGRVIEGRPRAAALLPVAVRNRVVAIVYGDDGEADVTLPSLGDVIAFAALAARALERLLLRKKLGARAPELPLRPPQATPAPPPTAAARGGGAAALVRTFAAPPGEAPAAPEPPPAPVIVAAPEPEPASEPPPATAPEPYVQHFRATPSPVVAAAEIRAQDAEVHTLPRGSFEDIPRGRFEDDATYDESQQPSPFAGEMSEMEELPADALHTATPDPVAPSPAPRITERSMRAVRPEDESAPRVPVKRGPAPVFAGRNERVAEPTPLEPLPRTPPPNATAWTSFPSPVPPPPLPPRMPISDRPIPREEIDSSPGASFVEALDPTPGGPLPSVIVDIGAEYTSLLQRAIDGGPGSQEAFAELIRHGEQVLQPLMAKFPGPLRVDRHRARDQLPAASQCGPILELVVAIRRPALPFVSVRASSPDPETRFWATHVLGELRYAESSTVLVPRLFDDDPAVRRIARRSATALVNAGSAGGPILQGLDNITRNPDHPPSHRVLAIETMGEIRTGAMVPPLIAVLSDRSEEVADAARRALLLITRQDFGRDGRKWGDWWSRNGSRHRIEWLMDALMHDQPSLRRAAGDELKLLTKEYFGYYDDLPKKERERAQGLYRTWWDREGKARFN